MTTIYRCTIWTSQDGYTPGAKLAEWERWLTPQFTLDQFIKTTDEAARREFPAVLTVIDFEEIESK